MLTLREFYTRVGANETTAVTYLRQKELLPAADETVSLVENQVRSEIVSIHTHKA
jgi:hypothetical protein